MRTAHPTSVPTVADAIENTLEWLDRQGCADPEAERRNTRRSRYRVTARVCYLPPGACKAQTFDVTTRNLSRAGLSFVHDRLIYPSQAVDVQLPLPDRSVRHMRARVVRVRPTTVGVYEIGVEFTEMEVAVA